MRRYGLRVAQAAYTTADRLRCALLARRMKIVVFGMVGIIATIVYYPALEQLDQSYGDQPDFMLSTEGYSSLPLMIKTFYSWNRMRKEGPSDTLCFRPLMMVFLVCERWLFGESNVFGWKMAGVILHLVVVWKLLTLLLTIRTSAIACAAAFLFATMTAGMQMVYYSHINGYMLALVFFLGATYHLYVHAREGQTRLWRLLAVCGYLLLACFTYDGFFVYGFLCAGYLMLRRRDVLSGKEGDGKPALAPAAAMILIVPSLAYLVFNFIDYRARIDYIRNVVPGVPGTLEDISVFYPDRLLPTIRNFFWFVLVWILDGVYPSGMSFMGWGRSWGQFKGLIAPTAGNFAGHLSLCILSIAAARYVARLRFYSMRRLVNENLRFGTLSLANLVVVISGIIMGRANLRGCIYLCTNSYYAYMFWLFLIVTLYAFFCLPADDDPRRPPPAGRYAITAALLLLAVSNGITTYRRNVEIRATPDIFERMSHPERYQNNPVQVAR